MSTILKFLKSKQVQRWMWEAFDAFLALLIVYLTDIQLAWAIPIFATVQFFTKEMVNKLKTSK
jgi:hypothetical protein